MTPHQIAELIETAFRQGWVAGEDEGRAYGFTGKLAKTPDKAWRESKMRRTADALRRGT